MLATHSLQTEDVFKEKKLMPAKPSGQDSSTAASREECGEEGGSVQDRNVLEEVVEEAIDVEGEEEEEKRATPPSLFLADSDKFKDWGLDKMRRGGKKKSESSCALFFLFLS